MKDWIIISDYDCGYTYSISIDGKVMDEKEIKNIQDCNNPYKDIWYIYNLNLDGNIEKIQTKYHKNVLLCRYGNIEFYEITQK